jgi:hypothetical protein
MAKGRLAPPVGLERPEEPGWGGLPQPGAHGRDVLDREVGKVALVAAVLFRPVEDERGHVLAPLLRLSQHPPRDPGPESVTERRLQLLDGGEVLGRRGGKQLAQDGPQSRVGHGRPVETCVTCRQADETGQLAFERSVAGHARHHRLVQRDTGVGKRSRSDRGREAGRSPDQAECQVEPCGGNLGVEAPHGRSRGLGCQRRREAASAGHRSRTAQPEQEPAATHPHVVRSVVVHGISPSAVSRFSPLPTAGALEADWESSARRPGRQWRGPCATRRRPGGAEDDRGRRTQLTTVRRRVDICAVYQR